MSEDQTVKNSPNVKATDPFVESKEMSTLSISRPHLCDVLPTYVPVFTAAEAASQPFPVQSPADPRVNEAVAPSLSTQSETHRPVHIFGTPNTPQVPLNYTAASPPRAPVRVACHRGDWRNYVENTLEAIESCIHMGADIVEIDVWRTKDGELVLMHDETVDRTTNGHGKVSELTLSEIRALRMKDGLGNMTDFTVPTVEEALLLAKDRIVVNLDKADVYFDQVYELLVKTGTLHQTILKSTTPFDELRRTYGDIVDRVIFMPVLELTADTTLESLQRCFLAHHDAYEINFTVDDKERWDWLRRLASETGAVLWVNTIWPSTCAGHSDDYALQDKARTWGYVLETLEAGIVQTDRPQLLLQYLNQVGRR